LIAIKKINAVKIFNAVKKLHKPAVATVNTNIRKSTFLGVKWTNN